jgi:hypothetical protein
MMSEKVVQQLKEYVGRWVALAGSGDEMTVVGSGDDAVEASEQAEERGYKDTTLYRVLPANAFYVPLA